MLDDVGRERDRRLLLAVRVPSNYGRTPPTPETAREIGCDVPAWVKQWLGRFRHGFRVPPRTRRSAHRRVEEAITTVPVYGGIECTKGGAEKNLTADEYRQRRHPPPQARRRRRLPIQLLHLPRRRRERLRTTIRNLPRPRRTAIRCASPSAAAATVYPSRRAAATIASRCDLSPAVYRIMHELSPPALPLIPKRL